jgi:hypothetical protein
MHIFYGLCGLHIAKAVAPNTESENLRTIYLSPI